SFDPPDLTHPPPSTITETASALDYKRRHTPFASILTMKKKSSPSAQRKPRADAQRNRESILDAAKQAFTRDGANASLDDIAKQAGVGAGTLYRHFPTRDALIEAVYRSEVDNFVAAGRQFAATLPPIEALRAWMLRFIDLIAAKQL